MRSQWTISAAVVVFLGVSCIEISANEVPPTTDRTPEPRASEELSDTSGDTDIYCNWLDEVKRALDAHFVEAQKIDEKTRDTFDLKQSAYDVLNAADLLSNYTPGAVQQDWDTLDFVFEELSGLLDRSKRPRAALTEIEERRVEWSSLVYAASVNIDRDAQDRCGLDPNLRNIELAGVV